MYDVTNDDETKNYFNLGHYILSYGISAQYRHQSGAYGLASVGLNHVDITGDLFNYFSDEIVDVSKPNGTTFIGTVGYMISPKFSVEASYKTVIFSRKFTESVIDERWGDNYTRVLNCDFEFSTFTLGTAYTF